MSIAELNDAEDRALMILRAAGTDGHCFEGSPFLSLWRECRGALEARGFARIINKGRHNETAFITVKGLNHSVEPQRVAA